MEAKSETEQALQREVAALKRQIEELKNEMKDKQGKCLIGPQVPLFTPRHRTDSKGSQTTVAQCLSVVVLGASGDLAKKKTFPALFSLFCNDLLPKEVLITGYARSKMDDEQFRKTISQRFDKKYPEAKKQAFLSKCHYYRGAYDSEEAFAGLAKYLLEKEEEIAGAKDFASNRIFYFAIPPSVFVSVSKGIHAAAMSESGWNRVIVEKPFGHDLESAKVLNQQMTALFEEKQIFRIDHYLGKEMVQNLMVLRFANAILEPLWNANHISMVQITFKEDFGTQGRGGYFDSVGIIRDVMQNHLVQILALIGMEPPVSMNAEDVRDEKLKLLRAVAPIVLRDVVLGQYGPDPKGSEQAYTDDETVPDDSITPTYATAVLHVKNPRWRGVPFVLKCGKALNEKKADIRIVFKKPMNYLFEDIPSNELVLRVQPNEAVYLKTSTKKPGLSSDVIMTELDLSYKNRLEEAKNIPDAYERLILDVIRGDHNLFVRDDEMLEAWKIFTPLLHQIENEKIKPERYEFGSRGPESSDKLIQSYGYVRNTEYSWPHQA